MIPVHERSPLAGCPALPPGNRSSYKIGIPGACLRRKGKDTDFIVGVAIQCNARDPRTVCVKFLRRQRVAVEILRHKEIIFQNDRAAIGHAVISTLQHMGAQTHPLVVNLDDFGSMFPANAVGQVNHRLIVWVVVNADDQRNFSVRVIRSQNGVQQPFQRILSVVTNGDNGRHFLHIALLYFTLR